MTERHWMNQQITYGFMYILPPVQWREATTRDLQAKIAASPRRTFLK
jgi:hypothetical protein